MRSPRACPTPDYKRLPVDRDAMIDGRTNPLLAAQIDLGRLNRHMPPRKDAGNFECR